MKIKRALISVSDKTGLVEFAKELNKFGVEIISTGGTFALLKKQGIPAKEISQFTGSPEILDGRVKTLHPKVHGGLLFLRGNPAHEKEAAKDGIHLTVLVVVDPAAYADVLDNIRDNDGATTLKLRERLAIKVFVTTSNYDSAI